MDLLAGIPFALILAASTGAVFCHSYHDNLLQRVGLSTAAIGSALELAAISQAIDADSPTLIVVYGASIYAVGCMVDAYRARRK